LGPGYSILGAMLTTKKNRHSGKQNDWQEDTIKKLLDWSSKQSRILTACGKAEFYYTHQRGYPYDNSELPHHHLSCGTTHTSFWGWAADANKNIKSVICGAWSRPLFMGQWEHSTGDEEEVFNVQTNTLFIDLRIPRDSYSYTKGLSSSSSIESLVASISGMSEVQESMSEKNRKLDGTLSKEDLLRLLARRHVFGGYSRLKIPSATDATHSSLPVCTRHHCIDWNYIGEPRNRPNKWYVELNSDSSQWKEWSFAKDDHHQSYYWEKWSRVNGDERGDGLVLAMRKSQPKQNRCQNWRDGILVVVGVSSFTKNLVVSSLLMLL